MNLTSIENRLESLDQLDQQLPTFTSAGNIVGNLDAFRKLVKTVRDIPGFESLVSTIERSPVLASNLPHMSVGQDVFASLVDTSFQLRVAISTLKRFLPEIGIIKAAPDQVHVLLKGTDQLSELISQLTALEKALHQTILDSKIGGKLELRSVENGSVWLVLSVGSLAAVGFIGGLAWAAAVVYKKVQEARIVEQHVKSLEIKNTALEEVQQGQAKLIKCVVEAEARHLEKETFGEEENPERLERIKHAIKLMQELIEKGAEIHPNLLTPEKVSNLFPDFNKLGAVDSRIKQITEKAAN